MSPGAPSSVSDSKAVKPPAAAARVVFTAILLANRMHPNMHPASSKKHLRQQGCQAASCSCKGGVYCDLAGQIHASLHASCKFNSGFPGTAASLRSARQLAMVCEAGHCLIDGTYWPDPMLAGIQAVGNTLDFLRTGICPYLMLQKVDKVC